ncbi:hypothetical protein [Mesorhizobium sp. M0895]|uniref:hypothetical protein n=1 Tax=Mesorhizobium sp. M0895 TaxID=2957019 RepID=UPI003339E100
MAKHRTQGVGFKRQVSQEYFGGETLHALSKRHDISHNLIRIWVEKFQAGALDEDAAAADLLQAYEARFAAFERLVGKQALELEFLKGLCMQDRGRETGLHPRSPVPRSLVAEGCRLMGIARSSYYDQPGEDGRRHRDHRSDRSHLRRVRASWLAPCPCRSSAKGKIINHKRSAALCASMTFSRECAVDTR